MFREIPSLEGLRKQVEQKHLSSSHGAVQFFCFLSQGPAPVRQFVRELGNSVDQPMLDDCAGVASWMNTMDSLFKYLPTNLNVTETISWITRRFIAKGLTEAVLNESRAHGADIRSGVAGVVQREGQTGKKKTTTHSGLQGGPGFAYTPNP